MRDQPTPELATQLPFEAHEGIAPVALTGEYAVAHLVGGGLRETILRVALPAVASSLLMTLFSSVDAFWVGTRLGSAGLAAVSTSLFWIWAIISLAEMIGVGLTSVAARRLGERRPDEAARLAGDGTVFAVLLGLAVAVAGSLALPSLLSIMEMPADVTALATRYLHTYLVGTPLIYGFFAVDATFRASGDTRTPFVLLLASVAVTLLLDPLLMLGIGPFPTLGIAGAAIATITTRGVAFIMGATLATRRGLLRFGPLSAERIWSFCRVGLPTAITGMTFSFIYVLLTRTVTRFGTPALAAIGIGHRVESWLFMIGVGFGAATAAIVGQNLGAGRADRASRAAWMATGYCTLMGVVAFALELVIPRQFASLFSSDPAVIAEATNYLRIASISQLAICAEVVLEGALGGAGETVPPMLTSTALTAARIPLAGWAASRWGSVGVWWVISLTAIGRAVAMASLWRAGRWRSKAV
ncbi:MAG TPA: MATE family efflux transporter [Gemmatimonadaceae bacterium]|nr:MATE family efflux transporter [Gemmatimonadaceae bacterium]